MDKFKILYVDDIFDNKLLRYLQNFCHEKDYEFCSFEYRQSIGYKKFLMDSKVQKANIILMDYKLFTDNDASNGKISGEELLVLLKNYQPFTKVIMISQNDVEFPGIDLITKCNLSRIEDYTKYYDEKLKGIIDNAILELQVYQNAINKINDDSSIDEYEKDILDNMISGISEYRNLTKEDIDELINEFKKISKK